MKTEIIIDWIEVLKWYIIGGFLGVFLCYFVRFLSRFLKIIKCKFELEPMKYNIYIFILSWITVLVYMWYIVVDIIDPLLYRKYKYKYWYWVFKSIIIEQVFSREYIMEKHFNELYWKKYRYYCCEIDDNDERYRKYKKIKDRFFKRYYGVVSC